MINIESPKNRDLNFTGNVNQHSITELNKSILEIEKNDFLLEKQYAENGIIYKREPINIYIESYGGEIYPTFGLLSTMDLCTTPIRTIAVGSAMSCGFLILIHGHERYAYKNASIMYHSAWTATEGGCGKLMEDVQECYRLQKKIEEFTLNKTKIEKEKLNDVYNTKKDWIMTSQQALKFGVIDNIMKRNFF